MIFIPMFLLLSVTIMTFHDPAPVKATTKEIVEHEKEIRVRETGPGETR